MSLFKAVSKLYTNAMNTLEDAEINFNNTRILMLESIAQYLKRNNGELSFADIPDGNYPMEINDEDGKLNLQVYEVEYIKPLCDGDDYVDMQASRIYLENDTVYADCGDDNPKVNLNRVDTYDLMVVLCLCDRIIDNAL